ncbi:hypothetical protein F2Q65_18035 [Thiohalocapsa marina]|uniref:Efflux RND transporter periplasmic adaptor subunit n=1 Tax=Thiohalocapsa marina TaxID=424902 RepID=A0A5M8FH21_9GAMM|nr:hypothetical protein [Thiohalocapsa marina]KAA6182381.1 hypothetical protein F2Q65_18035 [Thiohalocapsa marina]
MMPRSRILVLFSLFTLGLGAWWYPREPAPIEVRIQEAAPGTVEEIVANTRAVTLKPCRRIKAEVSMRIASSCIV